MNSAVDLSSLTLTPWEIIIRLAGAMVIGAIIGTEREYTHRPAGMRTHMLVALGSCAVMVTSQLMFVQYHAFGASPDPARLPAQVIAGVGFLGAGTILRDGTSIKGLTTAASVWAVACLGIAIGAGYYILAVAGTACMLITLTFFEWLQKKLIHSRYETYLFLVQSTNVVVTLAQINKLAIEVEASVSSIQVNEINDNGNYSINFRTNFSGRHASTRMQQFLMDLTSDECTVSIKSEQIRL